MAIRISKYYLRFAILALLAGFSFNSFAGYKVDSGGWSTPVNSCYATRDEACKAATNGAGGVGTGVSSSNNAYCDVRLASGVTGNVPNATCSTTCPTGQERFNGICVAICSAGTTRDSATGVCGCAAGEKLEGGICVADTPCDAQDAAAAQAAISPTWSYTTVVPLNNGFNTVNESVNDYDRCESTCKVRVHATIKVGGVFGASYTVVESGTEALAGGACENMTPSNAKVTGVNIGYGGEGTGCASGFVYGSVNGVQGCHYVGTAPGGAGSTPVPGAGQPAGGSGTSSSGTSTTTTTTTNSDGTTSTSTSTTSSSGTAKNPVFGNGTDGSGIGCDPTSADYFQCTKSIETAPDQDGSTVLASVNGQVDSKLSEAHQTALDGIADRAQPPEPTSLQSWVLSKLPQPVACSTLSFVWKGNAWDIPCDKTQIVRDWFSWVLSLSAILYCFQIAITPRGA